MDTKKTFVGLVRDHRTRIGRIKATKKMVSESGSESKVKDSEG